MNKFLIGGAAVIAITAAAAIASAAPATTAPAPRRAVKAETRADVQAHVQQMFAKLDANRDGFVTSAETDAVQAQRAAKLEQRAKRLDPAKMFAHLDANNDGKITQAEAEAAHNARVQANSGQPAQAHATAVAGLFARADTNKDGAITRAEFDLFAGQMHARLEKAGMQHGVAGRLIAIADANKDGRVSLAEAQATALARFDRADLNHDGTLTPQERQQVRQALKAQRRPG